MVDGKQETGSQAAQGAATPAAGDEKWVPAKHGTEKGRLQKRVARGLTWTFLETWGSQAVSLVIFAILAHILSQTQFGLVALAAVFVNFAQLFVDQGLGDALIQRKVVTRMQIDTAFWVAVVTGAVIMLIGFALAIPISILVAEPEIAPIIAALSLTFLETSFSSVQIALLRREMRFKSLAMRRLAAALVAGVVGVSAAFAGAGAWALVANELTFSVVSVFMLWTVSPWRPSFQWSRSDFRELFGFGANVVGSDVLNFLSRNVDDLLVGVALGPASLGIYGVGYKILDTTQTLLVNAARKLVFPVFSRIQNDVDRTRRAYGRVNRALSVVILPGYIGLAIVAQEAVVTLFGQKWADSGPVAATLYLIGPVLTLQVFSGAVLNSVGHPEVTLRFRVITTTVHITGFVIAVVVFHDIVAVAAAFVIGSYLMLPYNLYLQRKYAHISIFDHLWQLRWVALCTVFMAAAVYATKFALTDHVHPAILLFVEVAVGVIAYTATILIFERALFREVVTVAMQAVPGGDRIARLFHIRVDERQLRRQRRAEEATIMAEAREVDMGMDIVADMGVDEARTVDI